MSHENHHLHEHHHHAPASLSTVFILCIILNLLFVLIEAGVGFGYNSLGLLSDAGHNLSDVFSLLLSLFAIQMARRHGNKHFTYGYKKSTVLASLANAIILLIAVGCILIESIYKLRNPEQVSGAAISWTAGAGILINGITTLLLMRNQGHDLNVKGAFLHMAMDTLVSLGVVISGIVILLTGFVIIDTLISLAIACIILASTWKLLKESLYLSLDAVPDSVNLDEIGNAITGISGIENWHHLHVWAVSTTENAATVHVVIKDVSQMNDIKQQIKHALAVKGISHSTIEFEFQGCPCCDKENGCFEN